MGYSLQFTERFISNKYILLNSLIYNDNTWNRIYVENKGHFDTFGKIARILKISMLSFL